MKILVICDDFYHHGEIVQEGLSFLESECELIYATDISQYSFIDNPITDYNVIILAKDNQVSKSNTKGWLTENIEQELADYVENGAGLLFIHAGSVLCKRSPMLKNIAGCEFISHPEQCEVKFEINSQHPIINGVKGFREVDEHYFIDFTARDADVFLLGSSEHGTQPAGYARIQGNGRVCTLTPGHNLFVWQNEQYKQIIRNAVYWCAREKV